MNKFSKILITFIVAVFVSVIGIFVTENNILEKKYSEKIKIDDSKIIKVYKPNQEIILSGVSKPESEIVSNFIFILFLAFI